MQKKEKCFKRVTLMALLLVLTVSGLAFAGTVGEKPKITAAYMDDAETIYATLGNWKVLDGDTSGFTVEQIGGGKVAIKSVVNAESLDYPPDSFDTGFEIKGNAVRFVITFDCLGFPETAGKDENLYVVCDANNWLGMADGRFAADDAWKMKFNKSADSYELFKELGTSADKVSFGSHFQIVWVSDAGNKLLPGYPLTVFDYEKSANFVKITLDRKVDVTKNYVVSHPDYKPLRAMKRGVLELPEFTYTGDDLGAVYSKKKTNFRVWAPTADSVTLVLYKNDSVPTGKDIPMKKDVNGTWIARIQGDIKNTFYNYRIKIGDVVNETVDLYAKAVGKNGERGAVVDLASTNPAGWSKVKKPVFKNPEDAMIYEIHVRDFSINPNSGVSEKNRGKYLAFTELNTKGPNGVKTVISHLKEIGATHIQLQPVYDYGSVDEGVTDDPKNYNWGYDPKNYNVPEGSYSSNPSDPTARIKEFKEMIKALHENGIRVIMDVVYNHTYVTEDSYFNRTVPDYYYRTDLRGSYGGGSGCGNETASERAMVHKYIVDSVKYWATEYGIDGFRFDLMALHDKDTMADVEKELRKIDPAILIYGEPWTGGGSMLKSGAVTKGVQKGMHIAVFNDNIRNAIKGDNDGAGTGFATGDTGQVDAIKLGVEGTINDFTADPEESLNYVTSHDNFCLWDKIEASNPKDSIEDRKKMVKLSNAIVLTSQGCFFMQGGEDILRTKSGVTNSYNSGDQINQFDWQRKADNMDVFNYYKGMFALRKAHPAFRMTTAEDIKKNLKFLTSPANTVAFTLNNNVNGDKWKTIMVIYNPNKEAVEVDLPASGAWTVVADDDEAGNTPVKTGTASFTGKAVVPAISMMVLYQN